MAMRVIASERLLALRRKRARVARRLRGQPARVHYFHQADDPYSHLAVQKLFALQSHYRIEFEPHLVGPPAADYQGDSSRFRDWALRDARSIAGFFDLRLPAGTDRPAPTAVTLANRGLAAALDSTDFAAVAVAIGGQLWGGEEPDGNGIDAEPALAAGNRLRSRLGHYLGAMFYFDGEWYWGVDRMHLLERRLRAEGFAADPDEGLCLPLPGAEDAGDCGSGITLEYFPSLRSPYTAVGHARVVDLVRRSGVDLVLRPVIPMMMRGIPAPRAKQLYIMQDAAREARFYDVPFGRFVDPIGEPVKHAFALYPAACRQGKGLEFVGAYLSAAFAEGIDVTSKRGLDRVLSLAGVEGAEPDADWRAMLDENLREMMAAGLWGVPSFRVTDARGGPAFACWGQDRIWRVETEIARRGRLAAGAGG